MTKEIEEAIDEFLKPTFFESVIYVGEKIFVTVIAGMLFIGFPLWVVLDVGSKAFCRIYECPINRTSDTP